MIYYYRSLILCMLSIYQNNRDKLKGVMYFYHAFAICHILDCELSKTKYDYAMIKQKDNLIKRFLIKKKDISSQMVKDFAYIKKIINKHLKFNKDDIISNAFEEFNQEKVDGCIGTVVPDYLGGEYNDNN